MYIVLEIQVNSDGTVGTLTDTFINRNSAESKYHTILASAAISSLPTHSAVIMTDEGQVIMFQSYHHEEVDEEETTEE